MSEDSFEDVDPKLTGIGGNRQKHITHHTQVYMYDFTFMGKDDFFPTISDFVKLIQPLFKKWVFQLEEAPTTGRHHYQGRGSLFKKKRQPELCGLINKTPLCGMDVTESSNTSQADEVFYTMKYDTRVEGPWDDKNWHIPPYIPRQYRGLLDRLHPFQTHILDSRNHFNDREVNMLVDTNGCSGKSTVASLAQLHYGGAIDLPPLGDHKELLQIVTDILMAKNERMPGMMFVDLPRALTLDTKKLAPFMVAIEQIKKGHTCDCRNHYREWWFDSPAVWVFVNHYPHIHFMSKDRWRFWRISPLKTLIEVSFMEMSQMSQQQE